MGTYSKIPLSIEGGSLAQYLAELSHLETLTREEEQRVCYRIREGDEESKARLIRANLRFVVTVAKEYLHHGVPLSDLISEGNLGLIEAVDRFDPTRGFKFISYAVWWIRCFILRALVERGRPIRLPLNQVQALNRIYKASRRLDQEGGCQSRLWEIAEALELPLELVDGLVARGRWPLSLDAPLGDEEDTPSLLDLLNSEAPDPDEGLMDCRLHEIVEEMLHGFDERDAAIVRLYYGLEGREPMTLKEIAQRYSLTRERVRQIKDRAVSRFRHPSRARWLKEFWED